MRLRGELILVEPSGGTGQFYGFGFSERVGFFNPSGLIGDVAGVRIVASGAGEELRVESCACDAFESVVLYLPTGWLGASRRMAAAKIWCVLKLLKRFLRDVSCELVCGFTRSASCSYGCACAV